MDSPLPMRPGHALAVALFAVLAACVAPTDRTEGGAETATREPPPGAIHARGGHYMVPAGEDGSGCPQYLPWSASGLVTAAMYYRKADGGFTLYRSDTECHVAEQTVCRDLDTGRKVPCTPNPPPNHVRE